MLRNSSVVAGARQAALSFAEQRARRAGSANAPVRAAKPSDVAVAFLKSIDPHGWHNLVALDPANQAPPDGRTFAPDEWLAVAEWIDARDSRRNLYFTPNEPLPGAPSGKLVKEQIGAIRALFVDVDPKAPGPDDDVAGHLIAETKRLRALAETMANGPFAPTALVDSGGGIQAFWCLEKQIAASFAADAERYGRALARSYGGDSVQNVDRLMRLPGTLNLPSPKKAAVGRTARRAAVLRENPVRYSVELIARHVEPEDVPTAPDLSPEITRLMADIDLSEVSGASSFDSLPADLRERFSGACAALTDLRQLWHSGVPTGRDKSASGARFELASWLKAWRFSVDEFGQLLFVWEHAAKAGDEVHAWDDHKLRREIARAWARSPERPERFLDELPDEPPSDRDRSISNSRLEPGRMPSLRVVSGLIDAQAIPVREWVVQPRYPIGDVAQCVGEPGISKSTLMLRDALAIATGREDILRGRDAHGRPISPERLHASGPVLIYNSEDRLVEMERRLAAMQAHHGVSAADMRHPVILWSGADDGALKIMRRESDHGVLKRASGADALERTIREHSVVFAALDPQISLSAGGRENSNEDQDALLQEIATIASRHKAAIAVVHHTAKNTRNAKGDIGAGRGGFAAVGKVRSAFTLVKLTGEDDEREWSVGATAGEFFRLDSAKVSHDRKSASPIVFRRVSAPVGNGLGVRTDAAEAMFDANPREALRMAGDYAPVLEIVDVKARAAEAGDKPRDAAQARKIGEIVVALMGETDEMPLGEIWSAVGVRMREARVSEAKNRPAVTGLIVSALAGTGVSVHHLGQSVLLKAAKKGSGEKAPWVISRSPCEPESKGGSAE